MKKNLLILSVIFALSLSGCNIGTEASDSGATKALIVFAGTRLSNPMTEIGDAYEASHPDSTVKFVFANSKKQRTDIEQGKTVDIVISGIPNETKALSDEGYFKVENVTLFTTTELVVAFSEKNPANIQTLDDLTRSGVKIGLVEQTAPFGKRTHIVLSKLNSTYGSDYLDSVLANVVTNEKDTLELLTKIETGEVDAGIVNSFDFASTPGLKMLRIPLDANVVDTYDLCILTKTKKMNQAQEFLAFVLSEEGQAILAKWGFFAPQAESDQ